jgi:hypothetical protein
MRAHALLAVALAGASPASFAAIYTCTDDQGRTVFRDSACPRGERGGAGAAEARPGRRTAREPAPPLADAARLARTQVTRIIERLDRAMARRNAKAVSALLAPDAQVHWQVQGDASARRAMDRADYAEYLREAFAREGYAYRIEAARVSLSKREPRATATRTLRETVLVDGRLHTAQVREKIVVEADGRKLLVMTLRRDAKLERAR